jgi:hypothetical protein
MDGDGASVPPSSVSRRAIFRSYQPIVQYGKSFSLRCDVPLVLDLDPKKLVLDVATFAAFKETFGDLEVADAKFAVKSNMADESRLSTATLYDGIHKSTRTEFESNFIHIFSRVILSVFCWEMLYSEY